MPERVDLELFLAVWLSILFPFIILAIPLIILFFILRRVYRHYRIPTDIRAIEHRQWEMRKLRDWIRMRKEVLDRGWESLGYVIVEGESEGSTHPPQRYRDDERLIELWERLEGLEREDGLRTPDLEAGKGTTRTD